jgi:hypothetical protein
MRLGWDVVILCLAVSLGGLAVWIFFGRILFARIDRLFLAKAAELPVTPLEIRQTEIVIGPQKWPFARGGDLAFKIEIDPERRLVLESGGIRFSFGPVALLWMADGSGEKFDIGFMPDPADSVSLMQNHSRLVWPVPFEINFLGGSVSRWRRHLYDRLVWRKSSGQMLEIVWRHQQWFYRKSGWCDQWDQRLVSVRISRNPVEEIAARYLRETKGWGARCYRLEHRQPEERRFVVAVIHAEDERAKSPGAGKSVTLLIDPAAKKVVKEIGGQ